MAYYQLAQMFYFVQRQYRTLPFPQRTQAPLDSAGEKKKKKLTTQKSKQSTNKKARDEN